MPLNEILKHLGSPFLPVVILVVVLSIFISLYRSEIARHNRTRQKLDEVYSHLEQRLYHELDELEKILREERCKIK